MQPSLGAMPGGLSYPLPGEQLSAPTSPSAAQVQQLVELLGSGAASPKSTAVVECPKSMVGRVIGKGGETIKALQQYTGAMIQIDQSCDPTRVTIAGLPQALQLAVAMVRDIVRGTFKGFAMLRQIAVSNNQGSMTYGQQHAPVYVQGYGFVPPSQAYSGAGSGPPTPDAVDPLAALLVRTAAGAGSAGPASLAGSTPPLSPLRATSASAPQLSMGSGLASNCSPDIAAIFANASADTAPALSPSTSPLHPDSQAALMQLLSGLSVAGGDVTQQQYINNMGLFAPSPTTGASDHAALFGRASNSGTPPGTPGAEAAYAALAAQQQQQQFPGTGGGVLDAAGVQTLLAQTALLSRNLRQQQPQQQQMFDPALLQSMLNLGLGGTPNNVALANGGPSNDIYGPNNVLAAESSSNPTMPHAASTSVLLGRTTESVEPVGGEESLSGSGGRTGRLGSAESVSSGYSLENPASRRS